MVDIVAIAAYVAVILLVFFVFLVVYAMYRALRQKNEIPALLGWPEKPEKLTNGVRRAKKFLDGRGG